MPTKTTYNIKTKLSNMNTGLSHYGPTEEEIKGGLNLKLRIRCLTILVIATSMLFLANTTYATTDNSESHMRYLIENTFESNTAKCLSVTDVNCTLFENNSILVKIYSPGAGSFTYSNLEHVSRNMLREAIRCHVIALNAYPVIEDMVVQIFDSNGYDMFRESRSTINGISEIDLAQRPEMLDNWDGLVQKMIGTRVSLR